MTSPYKNSYDLIKEIKNLVKNTVMASFNIKSQFTNIFLDETLDIIIKELFKDHDTCLNYNKKKYQAC